MLVKILLIIVDRRGQISNLPTVQIDDDRTCQSLETERKLNFELSTVIARLMSQNL